MCRLSQRPDAGGWGRENARQPRAAPRVVRYLSWVPLYSADDHELRWRALRPSTTDGGIRADSIVLYQCLGSPHGCFCCRPSFVSAELASGWGTAASTTCGQPGISNSRWASGVLVPVAMTILCILLTRVASASWRAQSLAYVSNHRTRPFGAASATAIGSWFATDGVWVSSRGTGLGAGTGQSRGRSSAEPAACPATSSSSSGWSSSVGQPGRGRDDATSCLPPLFLPRVPAWCCIVNNLRPTPAWR